MVINNTFTCTHSPSGLSGHIIFTITIVMYFTFITSPVFSPNSSNVSTKHCVHHPIFSEIKTLIDHKLEAIGSII